jgi:hypothetical protein
MAKDFLFGVRMFITEPNGMIFMLKLCCLLVNITYVLLLSVINCYC